MQGLSASSVVIDEFFDLLGRITKTGDLEQLTFGLANGREITTLSPLVFEVLASKCTQLKQLELYCTNAVEVD